jgi:Glycosyl hydrolases family 39
MDIVTIIIIVVIIVILCLLFAFYGVVICEGFKSIKSQEGSSLHSHSNKNPSSNQLISLNFPQSGKHLGTLEWFYNFYIVSQDSDPTSQATWLLQRNSSPIIQLLYPNLSPTQKIVPFINTIVAVRLLGGWAKNKKPLPQYDIVSMDGNNNLVYRWNLLKERLDPIVTNNYIPFIMLENVPYCFVSGPPYTLTSYGQGLPPKNPVLYGQFIKAMCQQLLTLYGQQVNNWRFQVWHEENGKSDYLGTMEQYLQMYDYSAEAIKSVFSNAKIGLGHFIDPIGTIIWPASKAVQHCINGKNYATGKIGSPCDFLGVSMYGIYKKPYYYQGRSPDFLITEQVVPFFQSLKALSPTLRSIPVEIMEFGPYINEQGAQSIDPGVWGAAYTHQCYINALNGNINKIYQWASEETIGKNTKPGIQLLHGVGWLLSFFDLFLNGQTQTISAHGSVSGTVIKALSSEINNNLYLAVSSFNPNRNKGSTEKVSLIISPLVLQVSNINTTDIIEWNLNASTSIYDIIYGDLKQNNHLRPYPNNLINTVRNMATSQGVSWVISRASQYYQQQTQSLQSQSFNRPGNNININTHNNTLQFNFNLETPSIKIIQLTTKS